ncbi:MAG: hypothetical protein ACK4VI_07700 [Alphaproteobacteria bacterium]
MTTIEILNIVDARDAFSERIRSHLTAVFLDKAKSGALSADMADFALVEISGYWFRCGSGMEDLSQKAFAVISEREQQKTSLSRYEELQLAIAHEALFCAARELDVY